MKGGNFRDCGEEESHKKGNPGADAAGLCCSLLLFMDTDGTERKSCFYRKGEGHQRRLFGRFFFHCLTLFPTIFTVSVAGQFPFVIFYLYYTVIFQSK